jgi:hypothetical protein
MAKKERYNSKTSGQDSNTFNKGMMKDLSDVYMSEGMWVNAINAINNSHNGESGNIGNEMSNKYCSETPYTIIGLAHKTLKQWVLFSTDNIDSEIGIFDEATCSYTKIVNDPCLNFNQANLITAVVKENYDCTFSVYWQDDLNPDRVMNLDDPPYICFPKTIDIDVDYYDYDIIRAGGEPTTCDQTELSINHDGHVITESFELGSEWGVVVLEFMTGDVDAVTCNSSDYTPKPARFVVEWNCNVHMMVQFLEFLYYNLMVNYILHILHQVLLEKNILVLMLVHLF